MTLFKIARGMRSSLDEQPLHDGYAYFCTDDGTLHVDYTDANGIVKRKQINAQEAEMLGLHPVEDFLLKEDLKGSFATGEHTTASGRNSSAEGENTIASGGQSHVEGYNAQASGSNAHAEGNSTKAIGAASHSEGDYVIARGSTSHAEGTSTIASGNVSHAEGFHTEANNYASHAEGGYNTSKGSYSHSEGYLTSANGEASHAEGNSTEAIGSSSHAEGNHTQANGYASHSEGQGTAATASQSHAEGYLTNATGEASHAEGRSTSASGYASHAEGNGTIASEHASHAGGWASKANATGSFAHGNRVTADADYQAAFGTYNEVNTDAAFIVGNGNETTKSNALEVNKDGNTYFQKSLFVGGTGNNKSKAKEVATLDTLRITTRQMANALKGSKSGEAIAISDVSPIEHEMEVKISSDTVMDLTEVKVKRCGKNLLNYENFEPTYTKNGISFTNNGDGTVTASGTATVTTFYYFSDNIDLLGYYTLSGCPSGGSTTTYLMGFGGSNFADIGSGTIRKFPVKQKVNIFIKIFEGVTVENLLFKPQLEPGTTATEYEPYKGAEYTPNADGTVNGVTSLYPNTTLMTDTDGVIIDCEYNRDINQAFAELKQAIISLGGNI